MHRKPLNRAHDKKVFSHTADFTRAINLRPKIMRGGTRL